MITNHLEENAFVERLKALFGTSNVQVRQFINEDPHLLGLDREQVQRSEIQKGWKELGMGPVSGSTDK